MPASERWKPASSARRAMRQVAGEAVEDAGARRRASAEDRGTCRPRPRGCGSRSAGRAAGPARSARGRRPAARRAARSRSDSRGRSRRPRASAAARRSPASTGGRRRRRALGELPRRVRVDADREPDLGPEPRTSRGLAQLRLVVGGQNRRARRSTPAARARATTASRSPANSGPAMWQWLSISTRRRCSGLSSSCARAGYRTRVPGGTRSSTATRIGVPPSGLAASTMPFDSMPISLAGFRLATMTIVRPDELLGLVALGDAGDDRARLGLADVDGQLDQLLRLRHRLGLEHLGRRAAPPS